MAHHELTGKPYLPPRILGAGIAGCLLTELLDGGRPVIVLSGGYVVLTRDSAGNLTADYAPPADPVTRHVLELIVSEQQPVPARDWLLFLGRTTAAEVAERLERAGYLERPAGRVPWRSRRLVPGNQDWAHCALLRARAALDTTKAPTRYGVLLAGLATACGLGFRITEPTGVPVRSIADVLRLLPPHLRELIALVQVAADNALLSNRR